MLGPLKPPTIESVLNDPSASDWLKGAIRDLLERDPVDAANDSFWLGAIMQDRTKEVLKEATGNNSR